MSGQIPPPLIPLDAITPERLILGVTILVLLGILWFASRRGKQTKVVDEDLKAALASLKDGLVITDASNRIIYVNPGAESITGAAGKDLIGRQASGGSLRSGTNKNLWKILSYGEEQKEGSPPNEVALEEPETRLVQVTNTPVRGADGRLRGFMYVLHEVTEERLVEHMKTSFITILSHSLRTPLAGIKWAADYLKKERPKAEELPDIAGKIAEQEGLLSDIVESLITASELSRGSLAFSFTKTDLTRLLSDLAREFQVAAKQKGLDFSANIKDAGEAQVDSLKFKLAIRHVLDNAVKYTRKGAITVTAESGRNDITIKVKDTGLGIPKAEIPKLFTKFYWARNVIGHQHEGAGLGLYTAKSILDAHNGKIELSSTEGRGTTVTITIPRKH